jgi:hypothetical protein
MSKIIKIRGYTINLSELDKTKHKVKNIANELASKDLLSFNPTKLKELASSIIGLILVQLSIKKLNKTIFLEKILDSSAKIRNNLIVKKEEK